MSRVRYAGALAICLGLLGFSHGAPAWAIRALAVALPNSYYIERDRSGQLVVVDRREKVILAPLAGYAVSGSIVTGLVGAPYDGKSYPNDTPLPPSPEPRYFVLDTSTGRLQSGLAEANWKAQLMALGIQHTPELYAAILPGAPGR